ncbi:MAG: hypothetical protein COV76_08165 [Candidatus Omnitrophica bacterium CG11_big_fil_rev_8_21_14_0_20_64_10]|nr:MAG: hypothetical protein COV76_08165 [Candidatus Omnitrophica bacterium CG11_big_fil_rev_8_21_14_0_20_64_10]
MKEITKTFQVLVCFILAAQLAGCGTLLHPERRGQRGGRLDIGIVALDAIGLVFFLIPGIIAFAVDFHEGTIYLPPGARSSLDRKAMKVVKLDPKHATAAAIEEIVWKETGHRVKLNQGNMEVFRMGSLEEMRKRFAEISPRERNVRVALNTK